MIDSLRLLLDRLATQPPSTRVSPEEALALTYRVILGRSPDEVSGSEIETQPSHRTLQHVGSAFASEEFLSAPLRHITRLRVGNPGRVTWHIHLPRSAGSKFVADWKATNRTAVSIPLLYRSDRPDWWKQVVNLLRQTSDALRRDEHVLVSGHMTLNMIDQYVLPADEVVTTLREPLARARSLYKYAVGMASGGLIENYPQDDEHKAYFVEGWRNHLCSAGLNPDRFTLSEFLHAGMCPDGALAAYLSHGGNPVDLGTFMRRADIKVVQQERISRAETRVNATTKADESPADVEWLTSFFKKDLAHYESIKKAYGLS
jgi:hypothetical protein